jgi:hypothetical protein
MAQLPEIPEWLTELLAEYDPQSPVPVEAPIVPGDIRLCEGTGLRHHVLVVEVWERHANIALLTNDIDMASDETPILTTDMTGLPYRLLATNLIGPVWPHQLGNRLAQVSDFPAIKSMVMGRDWGVWAKYPHIQRGLPFGGRGWRWTAHEDALKDLQSLCCQAMGELLGEP